MVILPYVFEPWSSSSTSQPHPGADFDAFSRDWCRALRDTAPPVCHHTTWPGRKKQVEVGKRAEDSGPLPSPNVHTPNPHRVKKR